jgi:membrane protease YdiL (CAAX protease family)
MSVIVAAVAAVAVGGLSEPALADHGAAPHVSGIGIIVDVALLIACPIVLVWLWRLDVIRPGSFRRAAGRDLSRTPWLVWWVGALLMLMAQGAGGAVGLVLAEGRAEAWRDVGAALGGGIGALALGAWLVWLLGTGPGGATSGMRFRIRARDLGNGALGFVLSLPIVGAVTMASVLVIQAITGRETDPLAHETLKVIDEHPWSAPSWGLIFAAVVVVPIVEEILFRGMV